MRNAVARLAEIRHQRTPGLHHHRRVGVAPAGFPAGAPSGPCVPVVQAHGSGKPQGRCGLLCWRPAFAPEARARRRCVSGGFSLVRRAAPVMGGRGSRRRSPCGPCPATSVPTPGGLGRLFRAEQVALTERAASGLPCEQAQVVTGGTASRGRQDRHPRRRPLPQAGRSHGKGEAQVALGNTQLRVCHKLLSNPGMRHQDLGPGYYERQAATRRKIAYHVRQIEALGPRSHLARIPGNPTPTGQQPPQPPDPSARHSRRHNHPRPSAARPSEVLFSG